MGEDRLICTVGLPRSGKSTWAKMMRDKHGAVVVCPDQVRRALHGEQFIGKAEPFVWAIVTCMIRALFLAGHDLVILDATGNTRKRRDPFVSRDWRTEFHVVSTDVSTCLDRALADGMDNLIPIIEKMDAEHEPLMDDENECAWEREADGVKPG